MKTLILLSVASVLSFGATLSIAPINSSLVIYNGNRALVHETRDLKLTKNDTFILYNNVANNINTDTVNVKFPKGISLYSQQYRYDQLTLQKMLDAHINKEITIKTEDEKTANVILLSTQGSQALVRTKEEKIIPVKVENIIFSEIPKSLITQPSLVWNISAKKDIHEQMQLEYLISNISFTSTYILNIDKDSGNLTGWLNINNHSGKAFTNTSLALLAGDLNFARKPMPISYRMVAAVAENDKAVSEESFEGYHYYQVPFKVDLANNEKTQIKFLTLEDLKISRSYVASLSNPLYFQGETKNSVTQHISFLSSKHPLPAGIVRVYGELYNESLLLGESRIGHTPKDTPLDLTIGKDFDLLVTQTTLQRDDTKYHTQTKINYTIKNSSTKDKTITLEIPFVKERYSRISTDQKYTYTKGNFVTFSLLVKAESSKQFSVEFERKK